MKLKKILNLYKDGKLSDETLVKVATFKRELEKQAISVPGWMKTTPAKQLLMVAGGVPLSYFAAAGIDRTIDKLDERRIDEEKEPSYQRMLGVRPELQSEDEELVRRYFDTLHYFSPSMARDPLAAGAYIKNTLAYEDAGGPPYSSVASLVDTEKKMQDANPKARGGRKKSKAKEELSKKLFKLPSDLAEAVYPSDMNSNQLKAL